MVGIPQGEGKIIAASQAWTVTGFAVKLRKGGFHLRKAAISRVDDIPGFVKVPVDDGFQLLR